MTNFDSKSFIASVKSVGIMATIAVSMLGFALFTQSADAASPKPTSGKRLLMIHDGQSQQGILTSASTVREALTTANIPFDPHDVTEPGLDEPLVSESYDVNMYHARPVVVVDGVNRTRVLTAAKTPKLIARDAGVALRDEDHVDLGLGDYTKGDGVAERMTIQRATPFTFVFYGKTETAYTRERTVGDMLRAKKITMTADDGLSVPASTPITTGMTVKLWRNGIQSVTVEEDVAFPAEQIKDADRPIGYRDVKTPGVKGKRTVTYEVNTQNGSEVSRKEINSNVTTQPTKEVVVIGAKSQGGLSKAKGVMMFTDSNNISHRETYYDLPMGRVMQQCGQGGNYTVRSDGVKVDAGGYIIVAANLSRYPRCSVVETSLGPGKVYDTGGFAAVHPDGTDIATDWSNYDGR